MKTIKRIVLANFKRFKSFELELNDKLNVLISDNRSGKSSLLVALDLVLTGESEQGQSDWLRAAVQ